MPLLPSPPVRTRPLGPAFPFATARPGVLATGAPPARRSAWEWEGDGAPPPALTDSASSPLHSGGPETGAMCRRGLALDRPFLSLPWQQEGPLVRWGRGPRGVPIPSRLGPHRSWGIPLSRSDVAVRGTWSRFLFPGCGRAARPEN